MYNPKIYCKMKKVISILLSLSAMIISFYSCSKDDNEQKPSLDRTEVTLYVEESISLNYSGENCVWSSDNPLIASVEDGFVTANFVGETVIRANEASCKVTVAPRYTKYHEPYLIWNTEKAKVKQYMRNYEEINIDNNDQLAYLGKGTVLMYLYLFENDKLAASSFTTDISDGDYLIDYLFERFISVSNEGTTFYFISPDKNIAVALQINTSYLIVAYAPTDQKTKSITESKEILSKINKEMDSLIQK